MTIEWLAGNRIKGTTAERPNLGLPSGSVGGWVEVGRTTLGSSSYSIDVTSLPDKRYYMILANSIFTNPTGHDMRSRFNSDISSNYSWRWSNNGGSDTTNTTQTYTSPLHDPWVSGGFVVGYISNLSNKEKLTISHSVDSDTLGAGYAPRRKEDVGKWTNASDSISSYTLYEAGANPNTSGAEVVVLGWDPADTHTSNFWEELASVELSSSGDQLSTGSFSAKKYLWCQVFTKNSSTTNAKFTFNNDTGNNYAYRHNLNGSEGTSISQPQFQINAANGSAFYNMFIINNSDNEKLVIGHTADQNTAGAGTVPDRLESVAKWANTSSQITEIDVDNTSAGSFDTGSIIKVWGAD